MRFEEYRKHDAISLAGLIAKREVSAEDVLETAIARAEQVNPTINAIVHKQYEQARKAVAAGLPGGPLKGVPYLIKDLGFFETGEPATYGSSLFKDFVADHETAYVTRCKKAGLVFMGRSSSPEFGLNPNTEPRLYGSCRNPWNLEYSPGGSSGGAAAAVSAGILPVAHATDGGGSIRIPLLVNPDSTPSRFDVLRPQRLAAPVTVYVEQFSGHPLEADAVMISMLALQGR